MRGGVACVVSGITGTQKGRAQPLELPGDFAPGGGGFELGDVSLQRGVEGGWVGLAGRSCRWTGAMTGGPDPTGATFSELLRNVSLTLKARAPGPRLRSDSVQEHGRARLPLSI